MVGLVLYGLHRFALFAENRGWLYYRTRPPRVAGPGPFDQVFEPEMEHMIEEISSEAIRADDDKSGQGGPASKTPKDAG